MIHDLSQIVDLFKVVMIDVALSGDNAVVIGMAAATLAEGQRRKAIAIGMAAAILLRIAFSVTTVWLLGVPYIKLGGGLLLLWVCWKMFDDIRGNADDEKGLPHPKSLLHAVGIIIVADVSMSLDNVLAVAGASREHVYIMAFGLVLSIALMAVAADFISRLLNRHPWINWVGLALIFYVACEMIVSDGGRLWSALR